MGRRFWVSREYHLTMSSNKQLLQSNEPRSDDVSAIQKDVDLATEAMKRNLESKQQGNERLDNVHQMADDLKNESKAFQTGSTQLKNQLWWKNVKLNAIIALIVIIMLIIIIVTIKNAFTRRRLLELHELSF